MMQFLKEKGFSEEVASGMLRAMPNASVAGLKQMGDGGLRALSGAVAREVAERAAKGALDSISITVEDGIDFVLRETSASESLNGIYHAVLVDAYDVDA